MKTWTNPTVEELDVKLTAALRFTEVDEWEQNNKFEPERLPGTPPTDEDPDGFGQS